MKVNAYAKINLTLDVTGKRPDGYHTLDTIMQTVSLWDELELIPKEEPGIRLTSSHKYLPENEKNTAYRAAKLFFDHCGMPEETGLEISIKKRIPNRAGMGGGSADAAAVLRGLNEMYDMGMPREELMELGAAIGADVPFCVAGGACRCTGIGEKLEPLPPMPDCHLLICKPPAGMSTPRAYALMDQFPLSSNRATPKMVAALESGDLRQIAGALGNRFDETMKLAQVRQIKKAMISAGALGAIMTGSGSAVFGIFDAQGKAEDCAHLLEGQGKLYFAHPHPGK